MWNHSLCSTILMLLTCLHAQAWTTSMSTKAKTCTRSSCNTCLTTKGRSEMMLYSMDKACDDEQDHQDHSSSTRRAVLRDFVVATTAVVSGGTMLPNGATAAEKDDPLAQLDALAQQMGLAGSSSSNYPNSISPLPTLKQSAQELASFSFDPPSTKQDEASEETSKSSDLDQALKKSKSAKKVGPLTHG